VASPPTPALEIPAGLAGTIRTNLKARVPKLNVLAIHGTPLPGLYEVLSPDGVTYTDVSAEYVVMGQLLETRTQRNLTQEHWTSFNQVDFASLPFELAIKSTRGNGKRQIAVFADPKCPFCQELEGQLAGMDDVTIYTFLYPLEEVHPGATVQAHQIWCAADREAAWNNWMRKQEAPASSECADDPLKQLAALGEKLHIQTTPTIIFRSGLRAPGLPPSKQFAHMLDAESGTSATGSASGAAHPGA
jgi:thiol:disulfide interchange protein DsbC